MERTKINPEIIAMIKNKYGKENVLLISDNYVVYREMRWFYPDKGKVSCYCNTSDETVPEIDIEISADGEYSIRILPKFKSYTTDLGFHERCGVHLLEAVEVARKMQKWV